MMFCHCQAWGQLHNNVMHYITITLPLHYHYITITLPLLYHYFEILTLPLPLLLFWNVMHYITHYLRVHYITLHII
jgi:hypothetical protein